MDDSPDPKVAERAKHAAYMREWTRKNAEKVNAQRRARRTQETREREAAWQSANHEKILDYRKAWRESTKNDPERLARQKENKRRSAAKYREQVNAKARAKYNADPETSRAYLRAKKAADRERYRLIARRGTAKRNAIKAGATIGEVDYLAVLARDGWVCGICQEPIDSLLQNPDPMSLSFDHVIPLSRGSPHSNDNLQPAHLDCNKRKGVN